MGNILSDSSKFTHISLPEDKQLNFTAHVEKHIANPLKHSKNSGDISGTVYKSLKPRVSKSRIP